MRTGDGHQQEGNKDDAAQGDGQGIRKELKAVLILVVL
jgi:hypothetical protein